MLPFFFTQLIHSSPTDFLSTQITESYGNYKLENYTDTVSSLNLDSGLKASNLVKELNLFDEVQYQINVTALDDEDCFSTSKNSCYALEDDIKSDKLTRTGPCMKEGLKEAVQKLKLKQNSNERKLRSYSDEFTNNFLPVGMESKKEKKPMTTIMSFIQRNKHKSSIKSNIETLQYSN